MTSSPFALLSALAAVTSLAACDPAMWVKQPSRCKPGVITRGWLAGEPQPNARVLTFVLETNQQCDDEPVADLAVTRDGVAQPKVPFRDTGHLVTNHVLDYPITTPGDYTIAIANRRPTHPGYHPIGPWHVRVETVPLWGGGHAQQLHFESGVHVMGAGSVGVARWVDDDGRDAAWRVDWYRDGALAFTDHGRAPTRFSGLLVGLGTVDKGDSWWRFDQELYPVHREAFAGDGAAWEVRIFREGAPPIGARSSGWDKPYALAADVARVGLAALAAEPPLRTTKVTPPLCRAFPGELRALQRSAEAVAGREAVDREELTRRDGPGGPTLERIEIGGQLESYGHRDQRVARENAEEDAAWAKERPRMRARTLAMCAKLAPIFAAAARGPEPVPSHR